MTTQPVQTVQTVPLHPILDAVAAARDAMKAVRDVQPVFMIAAEKETAVAELARLEAMAAELKLRVVASAGDAAAEAGARDNGAWLASVTRTDFPAGTSSNSSHPRSPRPRKPNASRTRNNEPGRRPACAPG